MSSTSLDDKVERSLTSSDPHLDVPVPPNGLPKGGKGPDRNHDVFGRDLDLPLHADSSHSTADSLAPSSLDLKGRTSTNTPIETDSPNPWSKGRVVADAPLLSDAPSALHWLVSEGYFRKNEDGFYRAFQGPRWFHLDLYVCAVTILAQAAFEVCGEPATVRIRGAYGVLGYQLVEAAAASAGAA